MSHEVETMAYTNEVPWHGLGHRVDQVTTKGKGAVKAMLKAAKLDWEVATEPLFTADGTQVPANALRRSSDGSILDVVGNGYVPVQNHEAFEFFREFVEAGDAHMETAGSLKGGRYVWGLANLGQSFKLKGNDEVKGYILVGCPHEQGKSLLIKFTPIRVVCNNTLTFALRSPGAKTKSGLILPEFRRAHRSDFDTRAVKGAQEALGIAREQLNSFKEQAEELRRRTMSMEDAFDVLQPVFAPKFDASEGRMTEETVTPRMKIIMDVYERAPGAQPGNAWGVLNAATYYIDHVASKTADRRMTMAWFGKAASQKEQILERLLRE